MEVLSCLSDDDVGCEVLMSHGGFVMCQMMSIVKSWCHMDVLFCVR